MDSFNQLFRKAVYLGIGLTDYAGEKASSTLSELGPRIRKLGDELVQRGELTTDEAQRFVDELIQKAQHSTPNQDMAQVVDDLLKKVRLNQASPHNRSSEAPSQEPKPRTIDIDIEEIE